MYGVLVDILGEGLTTKTWGPITGESKAEKPEATSFFPFMHSWRPVESLASYLTTMSFGCFQFDCLFVSLIEAFGYYIADR